MKKIGLFLGLICFFAGTVFAQSELKSKKPDQHIKVKRIYDDQGNLVGYDSTYVKTWSSDSVGAAKQYSRIQKYFHQQTGTLPSDSVENGKTTDWKKLQQEMLKQQQQFMEHFGMLQDDTSSVGSSTDFTQEFERMQMEFLKQVKAMAQSDSLLKNSYDSSDSLMNGQKFEELRKEMEKQFENLGKTMGGHSNALENDKKAVTI